MFEFINYTAVFIIGWGSVAIIGFIIYKFIRDVYYWVKGIRF